MLKGSGARLINYLRKLEYGPAFTLEFPLTFSRVWGAVAPQFQGTHAHFCLVQKNSVCASKLAHSPYKLMNSVCKKPKNISHMEAASLPYAGLTAQWCWKTVPSTPLYVLGGSGAVGTAAIQVNQLLKAWDVETATTCGSEAAPLVSSLGTDVVIDYQNRNYHQQLKALKKYRIINNLFLNEQSYISSLNIVLDARPVGNPNIMAHLSPCSEKCKCFVNITFSPIYRSLWDVIWCISLARGSVLFNDGRMSNIFIKRFALDIINSSIAGISQSIPLSLGLFYAQPNWNESTHRLRPVIDRVYSYEDLPSVYEKVAKGHTRGKTVVKMDKLRGI
uniref:Alcohol dehydrogenase-like C-terminal domain-containing protein n=1 Tax=Strigamia maritima TaxID=126957 RepID=T1IY24_STRMM